GGWGLSVPLPLTPRTMPRFPTPQPGGACMTIRPLATLALACATLAAAPAAALAQPETPNVGHTRHHHPRGEKHDHEPATPERFVTNREGAPLTLPIEEDAFFFVVFGDRTGGPADGVAV